MAEYNAHLSERINRRGGVSSTQSDDRDEPLPDQRRRTEHVHAYFVAQNLARKDTGWLSLPEVPCSAELLDCPDASYVAGGGSDSANDNDQHPAARPSGRLRPNFTIGPYDSPHDYLQTHYELLRWDSLQPLRDAIDLVRSSPTASETELGLQSLGIYERVRVVGLTAANSGLAFRVSFSTVRIGKQILWNQSKRLMQGSLLAMTPANDNFQNKVVAVTVAARPLSLLEKDPPEIDLYFARPEEIEIDPATEWVMIEDRSAFSEADRHVMLALQKMTGEQYVVKTV